MRPFHCLHCDSVLGLTDGIRLVIAELVTLERSTKMRCVKCGFERRWKPLTQPIPVMLAHEVAIPVSP